MKTCHVCGSEVDDYEAVCPECGTELERREGGLSLKMGGPEKKKPAVTAGPEKNFAAEELNGPKPVVLSSDTIKENVASASGKRKKSNSGIMGTIFLVVFLLALGYGVYYLFTNYIMKDDGFDDYEDVLEHYIEAVNESDVEKMKEVLPSYVSLPANTAQKYLNNMAGRQITRYTILDTKLGGKTEADSIADTIKLQKGKTLDIKEVCTLKVQFIMSSGAPRSMEMELKFIQVKKKWFLYVDVFEQE